MRRHQKFEKNKNPSLNKKANKKLGKNISWIILFNLTSKTKCSEKSNMKHFHHITILTHWRPNEICTCKKFLGYIIFWVIDRLNYGSVFYREGTIKQKCRICHVSVFSYEFSAFFIVLVKKHFTFILLTKKDKITMFLFLYID